MCFWRQRGAHFCKNTKTKCMRANISSKSYLTNRIFDASSYQDPSVILFFHLASPKEGPLCSRPTFLRRFLRLHRGGHKAKEKGMIFILIFSNFMKIEIVRKCASHCRREALFWNCLKTLVMLSRAFQNGNFPLVWQKILFFKHYKARGPPSPNWIDRWMWAVGRI